MARRKARLFLGNLPENSSENDVVKRLKKFGTVNSVEIKQKKEIDNTTIASTFAFVNIEAEHFSLQQCLEELRNTDWGGSYIQADFAKESFLERLQREREEASKSSSLDKVQQRQEYSESHSISSVPLAAKIEHVPRKRKTSFEDESDLCKEDNLVSKLESFSDFWKDDLPAKLDRPLKKERTPRNHDLPIDQSSKPHHDFSKSRRFDDTDEPAEKLFKRPDFYKSKPQISNNSNFKNEETMAVASEMKRLKALEEKSKALKQQKDAIKLSLSSVDAAKPSSKVIFDDNGDPVSAPMAQKEVAVTKNSKKSDNRNSNNFRTKHDFAPKEVNGNHRLFDDDDNTDTWQGDFRFKKQFEGKKGKKLLEMQARFKDDERFVIDERFAESDDESKYDETPENAATEEEKNLQEEKAKEMEILASVLGEPVQRSVAKKSVFNPMVRFDPFKPNHAKFELPKPIDRKLKSMDIDSKKKAGKFGNDRETGRAQDESEPLPVDEKQFYQVATNIKDLFKKDEKQAPSAETSTFSLRQMFSSSHEDKEPREEIRAPKETPKDKSTPRTSARPILRGFQGSKPLAMFTKKVLRPDLEGVTNTFFDDVDVEAVKKNFSEKRRVLGRMVHKKRVVLERQQHFKQKIGVASLAHKSVQRESLLRRKSSKPWEKRRGKR